MAKSFSPVAFRQEAGQLEEQYEALVPEIPDRPFLLPGDFATSGVDGAIATLGEAKWQVARSEREYQARQAMSGYLAQPYASCSAQTPAEQFEEREREEAVRAIRCGLPDSPTDMPARATSSRPFKGLRG
jgi:hypothetical protein